MRMIRWMALCLAVSLLGCRRTPPTGKNSGKNTRPDMETTSSDIKNGTTGEIVKPAVRPVPPPSPEEESVAKLNTADLVLELGKPEAREVASKVLAAKGEEVVPELVKALAHENWQVRAGAIFTLGRLGKTAEPALPDLKKLLESEANETVKDSIPFCIDAIEGK